MARNAVDPVYRHSLREAIVVLGLWFACGVYTLSFCLSRGYRAPTDEPVALVLGIPSWVVWGIFTPWIAVNAFAFWFCFVFVRDDDLGEDPPDDSPPDRAGEER